MKTMVNVKKKKKDYLYIIIKQLFDVVFSFSMLFPLFILSVIIKIVYIFNSDNEPIFYKQVRRGKNGKEFEIYKYRTMIPDAEKELKDLLKDSDINDEWKTYQKLKNDPRITPLGLFLRKNSIDELPQFVNVLKGDMSVIGPRPLVPGELSMHNGDSLYETVKPGITGWWACNGRSNTDYRKRLQYEYYYINNMSLSMDIKVFFRTIKSMLFKIGAH